VVEREWYPGSGGCRLLFWDHPDDCWPGASRALGKSISVPGVPDPAGSSD
jgi:hypothetical protein